MKRLASFLAAIWLISAVYPNQFSLGGFILSSVLIVVFSSIWLKRAWIFPKIKPLAERAELWQAVVVGAVLRIALVCIDDNFQMSDYHDYRLFGLQIAEGRYFVNPLRPPGPSWFSAIFYRAFGPEALAAVVPNLILSVFQIWLTGRLGARFFSKKTGTVAAWLMALSPEAIAGANRITTELCYFLLAHVAILVLFSAKNDSKTSVSVRSPMIKTAFVGGIFFGLALYWRSMAPLFAISATMVFGIDFSENRQLGLFLKRSAAMAFGFLLAASPMVFYNKTRLGIWSLESQRGGQSRYYSTSPTHFGAWNQPDQDFQDSLRAVVPVPAGQNRHLFFDRLDYELAERRFRRHWREWAAACLFFKPYYLWSQISPHGLDKNLFKTEGAGRKTIQLWFVLSLKALLFLAAMGLDRWAILPQKALKMNRFFIVLAILTMLALLWMGVEGRFHNVFLGWQCWLAARFLLDERF